MTALEQLTRAHVLFLNWRDPSHPQAGGGEVYCYEIARRFAEAGAHVSLVAARPPGAAPMGSEDGMQIHRVGGTYGVYLAAAWHLLRRRRSYDAVIDCQNGIPFFSPLFMPGWVADICVIHHVHQHQFDFRFRWPMNVLGRIMEKQISRVVYRRRPVVVVSPSTREGARRDLGFANPIYIVPNGSPGGPLGRVPRSETPLLAVVSRLMPQKRVDLLIRALPELARHIPDVRVDICGDGAELPRLRVLADELGVHHMVRFHGRVTEEFKQEVLARAWLGVVPSMAEGWGLTVIEANAVGTPALAYDVPGLRDSIQHGRTGWLLAPGKNLAQGMADALNELGVGAVREQMADQCRAWTDGFSWDHSAERLACVVLQEMRRAHRHRRTRRQSSDLSVIAEFQDTDGTGMEHAMHRDLRQTDSWVRQDDVFRLLLHGCDEVRALRVLRRLGVYEAATSLATRRDVLLSGGEAQG